MRGAFVFQALSLTVTPVRETRQGEVDPAASMGALSNMDSSSTRRAVIVTAIEVEFKAVREYLDQRYEESDETGNVYERGRFEAEDGVWDVLVAQTRATNQKAALATERAIRHFRPSVALFVGIAGGLKGEVAVGDVVAATKVYWYEYGKVGSSFESRPELRESSKALQSRATAVARSGQWHSRIGGRSGSSPRAVVGAIASGEKVLADTRSGPHQLLKSQFGDALAVEMEGFGFLDAAGDHQNVEALVIRGISDGIDGKTESDASGSQELAARHASAFAFEVLSKFSSSKATTSGAHPAFKPGTNVAEESQPRAPARKARSVSPSRPSGINLRNVMIVLLLGALGFIALQMFGRNFRPSRGNWQPQGPHSGSRPDWHRSYPPR